MKLLAKYGIKIFYLHQNNNVLYTEDLAQFLFPERFITHLVGHKDHFRCSLK